MSEDWTVDKVEPVQVAAIKSAAAAAPAKPRTVMDDVAGAISSVYRGTQVGDELNAAVAAPFQADWSKGLLGGLKSGFEKNLATQRQQEAGFQQAHPIGHTVASDVGAAAPVAGALLTGGASATPEVAAEAPGLLSTLRGYVQPTIEVGSRLGNAARGTVSAAMGGYGAGLADTGTLKERAQAGARAIADPVTLGLGALTGGLLGPTAAKAPKSGNSLKMIEATKNGLEALKNKAYRAVDDLGVAFTPQAAKSLVTGVTDDLAHLGYSPDDPELGGVHGALTFLKQQLSTGLPVTMGDLDRVRRVVTARTMKGGDDFKAKLGQTIRSNIDEFVGSAGEHQLTSQPVPGIGPNRPVDANVLRDRLGAARDMNTRFKKAEAIHEALTSADLKTGGSYAGFNIDNATRQAIRPFIDPSSNKVIHNLTADEAAAAKNVIHPGWGQDALRWYGRSSPLTGGLSTQLNLGAGGAAVGAAMTGHPLGLVAAGGNAAASTAAAVASNRMTRHNVGQLMNLVTAGGTQEAVSSARELQRRGKLTPQMIQLLNKAGPRAAAIMGALETQQRNQTLAQGGFVDAQDDPWAVQGVQ